VVEVVYELVLLTTVIQYILIYGQYNKVLDDYFYGRSEMTVYFPQGRFLLFNCPYRGVTYLLAYLID